MKKKLFTGLTATIMFFALVLTGCSQTVTPDKETTQKPNNTTQKIEAVETIGEMGKPEAATDGTITLTTTDSTGGEYTFKQIGGGYHQSVVQAIMEVGTTPTVRASSSMKEVLTVTLPKKVQTT